jgi:hypothetical protein
VSGRSWEYNATKGIWQSSTSLTTTNLSALDSSIVPDANVSYDLGSAEKSFRDLYLSGNSIFLGTGEITSSANGSISLPAGSSVGDTEIGTGDGAGVVVYANTDVLPYVGNSEGNQAFVKSNNRLYIWNGLGWYNVALINNAPNITSVVDSANNSSPFELSTDGSNTVVTVTATDSDGDPITYSANVDADFTGLGTITQSNNVFTITPFDENTATTSSGTVTFKATDGVNISSSVNTFNLSFEIIISEDDGSGSGWGKQQSVTHQWTVESGGLNPTLSISHSSNVYTYTYKTLNPLTVGKTYRLEFEYKSFGSGSTERFFITEQLYDTNLALTFTTIQGSADSSTSKITETSSFEKNVVEFVATQTTLYAVFSPDYPDDNTYVLRNIKLIELT